MKFNHTLILCAVLAFGMAPLPVEGQQGRLFTEPMEQVRRDILARCRSSMGDYGASVVKFCADEDIAAYKALEAYDGKHLPIIDRCKRSMLDVGGWSTVKFCADEDIAAEKALEAYDRKYLPIIDRCKRSMLDMGGWSTVKFCADEDIAAEKALENF